MEKMELKFKMKEGISPKVLIDIAELDESIQNLSFGEIIGLFKESYDVDFDVMLMDSERMTKGLVNLKNVVKIN